MGFKLCICTNSIPDGLTNILIWYGIINPSAAALASLAVNLFTPWRLTTSATDSGRLWCNVSLFFFFFVTVKNLSGSFTVFKSECFILWQVYQKSSSSQSPLRGSYKPLLSYKTSLLSTIPPPPPTYPHNLFHSFLIQVHLTYQCMSIIFIPSSTIFLWCLQAEFIDWLAVKLLKCLTAVILWISIYTE